jgi:hypothetical protein
MSKDKLTAKQPGISRARENWHNYHQDTAFNGVYSGRLPDRTLVPAEEYAERLKEYPEKQKKIDNE